MRQDKNTKFVIPISWRKVIPGIILFIIGIWIGSIYMSNNTNIFAGITAAISLASSGFLFYKGINIAGAGYSFMGNGRKKKLGNENAIILFARREDTGKDKPIIIKFVELKYPPTGARLHYFRNFKRHFYELFNDNDIEIGDLDVSEDAIINNDIKKRNRMKPVNLPDKIPFTPGLFRIAAAMETYKDAIEYSPPTLFQKLAPGAILLAMGIVGILMVMTTGG